MQLQMHVHQRFLPVLDVRGGILHSALAMSYVHSQSGPVLRRMETASQQAIRVQLLQPLRIVDVSLTARHRFDMLGID